MAPTRVDKATIIILDVGRNVSEPDEKEEASFFESARDCAIRFIEQKIISQGKSLLGIILLGSKKTDNVLAAKESGSCRHIEMLAELQNPTWKMIRDLPEKPSKAKGNWFDALLVAAEHFQSGTSGTKIANKQIILLSNFKTLTDLKKSDIEQIIAGFKEEDLELSVLGPDIYEENYNNDIDLVRQIVEATNGASATLEYTMSSHLLFHRKKAVNAMPWNVDLSIGPNIKIPVSSYIRTKDEPIVKTWMKAVKDPVTDKISTTESIEKRKIHIDTDSQTVTNPVEDITDIIKGYHYGQQVIPFSDCNKSMLYDPGQKSLILYGFTKSNNITYQHLNGDGLSYVFGRKNDKKAQYAVRCLVECLIELDLVGIVRRVYNNGNAPKMYALMPVIDTNNFVCLSMAGICYKDAIKNMSFPVTNIKKYECTNEQVEAFKELIKAMELTKAYNESEYDDTDAFPIIKMYSPSAQHVLDCIAFRAKNPDKPLPPPRDEIMMLFKVPPIIEKKSRDQLDNLKKLFVLKKVEIKKRDQKINLPMDVDVDQPTTSKADDVVMNEVPKIDINILKKPDIVKIGTIKPIDDYETLKGTLGTSKLLSQLAEAIESMFFGNVHGDFTMALNTLSHFRTESVKSEPSHYNNWLKQFKIELNDSKKNDIIDMINDKKFGYILESENSLSNIKSEISDESQLYENNTVPNLTEISISTEVNDLFDDM